MEKLNTQSTVSFNNSKNFSIYKSISDDCIENKKENISITDKYSNDESSPSTFKDRLNQIDMK